MKSSYESVASTNNRIQLHLIWHLMQLNSLLGIKEKTRLSSLNYSRL